LVFRVWFGWEEMGRIGFLRLLLVTSGIFALVLRCSCVATEITWEVKQRTVNAKWKTETIKLSLDNVEEAFTKGGRLYSACPES